MEMGAFGRSFVGSSRSFFRSLIELETRVEQIERLTGTVDTQPVRDPEDRRISGNEKGSPCFKQFC